MFTCILLCTLVAGTLTDVRVLLARAETEIAQGDIDGAMRDYTSAVADADRSGDGPAIRQAVAAQVDAYFQQGRMDRGLAIVNDRLEKASPDDPNRTTFLVLRAVALRDTGNAPGARTALDEALPLAVRSNNPVDLAAVYRTRGMLIWRTERDRPRAIADFEQALAFARRARADGQVVGILNSIGNVLRGSASKDPGALPEALNRYSEGLVIARRLNDAADTATILKNIGDVHRLLGHHDEARRALDEAVIVADRSDTIQIRWMARMFLGMLERDRDPGLADEAFTGAIDVLEEEAGLMALGDLHAGRLAAEMNISENPYDQFIAFLLATGRADRAFFVAERQRARVLLDALAAGRDAVTHDAPDGFPSEERELAGRIKRAQAALRSGDVEGSRRDDLVTQVGRDEAALGNLRLRLAIDRPALARARYPKLLSADEVRSSLLAPDEALVSFYLGTSGSAAWVATRGGLTAVPLPPRRTIDAAVRAALKAMRDPAGGDRSALDALARTLSIADITRRLQTPRVVVVPDGVLFDVPFEALPDEAGRPLVERYAVSYAPSASTLAVLRQASAIRRPPDAKPAPSIVAVANPIVSSDRGAATRQVDLPHLDRLSPLPATSAEAKQVAGLFGGGVVLEGPQAKASALRASGADRARIVHFATHGLIDEDRPERSGLVLTADPPNDDGLLQTREIYGLRFDADLVTLSACETALGQNVTGEGMLGLTRAFFYAGARAVVASLWDVEDAATARLMESFYRNIRDGRPIDIALQQAKLSFIRSGGDAGRPFAWASFVVNGQARATVDVPRGGSLMTATAIAGPAALVVLVCATTWARRRRR
jgi:CHAT domain-containing protein/tetratricopeptide (TPR) repeat protein